MLLSLYPDGRENNYLAVIHYATFDDRNVGSNNIYRDYRHIFVDNVEIAIELLPHLHDCCYIQKNPSKDYFHFSQSRICFGLNY